MASAPISPLISNANSPLGAQLQTQLQKLARRRNAQLLTASLIKSGTWGVGAATLAVLAYKTHLIADGPIWAPAAIIGASLLIGARQGLGAKQGEFTAAREADEKLRLDDELSSALAFVAPHTLARTVKATPKNFLERVRYFVLPTRHALSASSAPLYTNLVPAHVEEAYNQSQKLNPATIYPNRFDKRAGILCVLSLAFIVACFAPDTPLFLSQQEKTARDAIMQEGEKLVQVTKEIRRQTPPQAKVEQQLNQRLEKLGQRMARGRITKRAALGDMGVLKKEIQKAQAQSQNAQQGRVPQIAEALRDAPVQSQAGRKAQEEVAKNDLDNAARQLEQLSDKLQNGQLSPQEKQKAADDLDKVAKELQKRGGEANNQAAKKLQDAANALRQQEQGKPENQAGQQQNGQQNQQQPGQNGQQQPQSGQQQGQKPSQQGQQQQGHQNQSGQNGQGQKQPGQQGNQQQQGQQGQSQQKQGGQQSQQGGSQQGQQNQQGNQGSQQSPSGSQGQQGQNGQQGNGASDALRDMANNLRQGSGSGSGNNQNLQDMLNKLREAENGTNGGEQSGQGKASQQGQNGQSGQSGEGKSVTPGKDLLPSDGRGNNSGGPGLGPRNLSTGNKGGGSSNLKSKRTGDKRRYEDVWSDRLPKTKSKIDRIKGKWGSEGEVEQLPTRGEGKGGQAHTPYYEVYESYKKDAEDAVSRESVPPAYKQPVKDYFESIKP